MRSARRGRLAAVVLAGLVLAVSAACSGRDGTAASAPADDPGSSTTVPAPSGRPVSGPFWWGAATSAYQVEGAWNVDGKGPSVWDTYTHAGVTRFVIGEAQNGDRAIEHYDLARLRADLATMRSWGVTAYRFSVSWSRLLPAGDGPVNEAGVRYYQAVVDEVRRAGMEPVATLFHWDLPQALADRGGLASPEFPAWFGRYASAVFDALGGRVQTFLTVNEPQADVFVIEPTARQLTAGGPDVPLPSAAYAARVVEAHHLLLAHAEATRRFRVSGQPGRIGIVLNLTPALPATDQPADVAAARLADGLDNRFFLDALYRGRYPDDVLAALTATGTDLGIHDGDVAAIAAAKPDVLGVNYYAPQVVAADTSAPHFGLRVLPNPDRPSMFLGPVQPAQLTALLERLDREYGHPALLVTENGAGFPGDDAVRDGLIDDAHRVDYLRRHVDAVLDAREAGVDVGGYFVWTPFDNFEWFFGFTHPFGLVHVDPSTQLRTPKASAAEYARIVASGGASSRYP